MGLKGIPVRARLSYILYILLLFFPATLKGNKVFVVIIDHFTKWSEAFAVPNQEARKIARMLVTEIISRYSIPKELLNDKVSNFLS